MYITYYKINKKPFELTADPSFLWMSEKHKEGLAVLKYGLQEKKGFILLTGDVGIGKTTLINAFINSLGSNVIFANVTNPGLKRSEFYNLLGATFNIGRNFSGKDDFLISFRAFLEKCHRDGKQVLLIVDEAQRLGRGLLEEIRLLSNIELQSDKLLNIFIVGQDELNETLDHHENRALRQRLTLMYHLEPLSEAETAEYIQHRLHVAGAEQKIFTQQAAVEIYRFSGGYPRVINIICDHAMLTGYVKQKKTIRAPEIIECARELRLKKKVDIEPSRKMPAGAGGRQAVTGRPKKNRSVSTYFRYAAAIFPVFLLACFLYFPLKSGASFFDIMSFWKDQMFETGGAVSTQTPESPSLRTTFKVINKDTGTPEGLQAGGIGNESHATPSDLQPGTPAARQSSGSTSQPPGIPASGHKIIPDSEKRYSLAFEFDSNEIAPEGYERLMKTAALMKEHPELTLTISGHTDNLGQAAYNTMLSKYRADIAKNFLVRQGIGAERITSIGKGAEEPVADNSSHEGRRKNRRVEVSLNTF